eukprot:TRINITY_DN24461_c0_g1_i1.p4 TRINITY_DN24461_c0_g1~~TRINITY_DN24461_c0_g1_i1.p4  ORF type:complete len:184 (+),score=40.12 TRINITY_DN24461_c0_g1_i1:78-554(+)
MQWPLFPPLPGSLWRWRAAMPVCSLDALHERDEQRRAEEWRQLVADRDADEAESLWAAMGGCCAATFAVLLLPPHPATLTGAAAAAGASTVVGFGAFLGGAACVRACCAQRGGAAAGAEPQSRGERLGGSGQLAESEVPEHRRRCYGQRRGPQPRGSS